MNERLILMDRIQALVQELGQAENALNAKQVDSNLRERVLIRFQTLFRKQQQALKNLRNEVKDLPLDACWDSFRTIRLECGPLFRECLAFMEGALVRSAGLDGGLCQIADALLDDLSHRADISWKRFTILAEGEFFTDMAEIIRLRFPEVSIWNLPVAGHEFGHLVAQELKVPRHDGTFRYPFQEICQREGLINTKNVPFLHEHFADLFAVYALGPAFACTCILLRFDPSTAYMDEKEHPSYAKRVHFILKALEKMDEAEGPMPRYRHIIKWLEDLWQRSLVASRQPKELDQAAILELNDQLEELYNLVDTELPRVRYTGWLRAQRLADELQPDKDTMPMLQNEDTLSDVLNAAWLCRIQHGDEVRRIGERAVKLCRRSFR